MVVPWQEHWPTVSLEAATDPVRTISYGILKPGPDHEDGVPYVRVVNMRNDVLDAGALLRTDPRIANQYSRASLEAGDVLVSIRGTYGRVVIVPAALGGANITQDTARLAFLPPLSPQFAALFLRSPFAQTYMKRVARGVAVKGVNIGDLRAMPIPLPTPGEQRRIVEFLEDHLSRLDAAEASLVTARRRLNSWRKACLNDVVFRNSSALGTLRELVKRVEAGRSFGGSAPPAGPGEWGVVKVSAMTWGRFNPDENKAVSGDRVDSRFEIRPGDVLVSRANTTEYVGAPVLVEETPPRLLLSDKSLRLVPTAGVTPRWLVAVLSAPSTRQQISASATGTEESMRNVSQQALLAVKVPVASAAEQAQVVESMQAIDDIEAATERALEHAERRADRLRRALLAAAFSGRLATTLRDPEAFEELVDV